MMESIALMPVTKQVPKLRFKEFQEAWIEKRLEDIAQRGSGHTPNKAHKEYYDGGIPWISLADSNKLDQGLITETKYEVSELGIKNSSAVLHPAGTVLLSRDAGVGKSAVMGTSMAVSQHFMTWFCGTESLNNWFLYHLLQIRKPEFERIAIGSTIKTIGLPYFKKVAFFIPSLPEQTKIAGFLSAVDGKIQQLTRKKALLEQYKKGVMQQLFSQEIRFTRADGKAFPEWEEKLLGDLLWFKNGANAEKEQYGSGHKFINVLDILQNDYITNERIIGSVELPEAEFKKNEVVYGDILFQRSSETREDVGLSNVYLDKEHTAAFGGFVIRGRAKEEYHPQFMNFMLRSDKSRQDITSRSGGSTRYNIGQESLEAVSVSIPCLEEQQRIAGFLSALDGRVAAVAKQLEGAVRWKKGLLQGMFV